MSERINRIRKDINELDEYVRRNERNIKKLKEQYEKAVKINERFIGRIKAMEEEELDLERGMCGIRNVEDIIPSWCNDKE